MYLFINCIFCPIFILFYSNFNLLYTLYVLCVKHKGYNELSFHCVARGQINSLDSFIFSTSLLIMGDTLRVSTSSAFSSKRVLQPFLHSYNTAELTMDSRTRDVVFLIPGTLPPCQNLVPILPTMQPFVHWVQKRIQPRQNVEKCLFLRNWWCVEHPVVWHMLFQGHMSLNTEAIAKGRTLISDWACPKFPWPLPYYLLFTASPVVFCLFLTRPWTRLMSVLPGSIQSYTAGIISFIDPPFCSPMTPLQLQHVGIDLAPYLLSCLGLHWDVLPYICLNDMCWHDWLLSLYSSISFPGFDVYF